MSATNSDFKTLFDHFPVGIGLIGLDRKILDANPTVCHMLGRSIEELRQMPFSEAILPEDFALDQEELKELFEGKRSSYRVERRYVRADGSIFWGRATVSMVRNVDGQPEYAIGLLEDIEEQRNMHEAIRESEDRFRTLFNSAAVGIALVGADRHIVMVNDALTKMFGYNREEFLKMKSTELGYPDDLPTVQPLNQDLIEGRTNAFQVERRFNHKNGNVFWVRQTISAVRQPDGELLYLVAIMEDITEHKRNQEVIQESNARFKAMFDNASVGIEMVSLDRHIINVNRSTEQIIGYKNEELININPSDLTYPEDREKGMDEFQDMVAGKISGCATEKRYIRKDGRIIWAKVTYSLVRNKDGKPEYLIGMIEDSTKQHETSEKLEKQRREYREKLEKRVQERTSELRQANLRLRHEMEQRQRAEEALAARAAEEAVLAERTRLARDLHDAVTQTLFSASLVAEVLPDLWEMDVEEARKSTDELRQLTRGALAEMRTLLLELRPAALTQSRFEDLLKQLTEALVGRTRLPIDLTIEGEGRLPPEVQIAFYRIAQESLNNVVKYARAKQVRIHLQISCCKALLDISDDGIGFDSSHTKPTSLGMRIMRERAEAIGARLRIHSKPGNGTKVSVSWEQKGTNG